MVAVEADHCRIGQKGPGRRRWPLCGLLRFEFGLILRSVGRKAGLRKGRVTGWSRVGKRGLLVGTAG